MGTGLNSLKRLSEFSMVVLALSACQSEIRIPGDVQAEREETRRPTPAIASIELERNDPNNHAGYAATNVSWTLNVGAIKNAYADYCILENNPGVSHCAWLPGPLPATYTASPGDGVKKISVWVRSAEGKISPRVDSNEVVLDTVAPSWGSTTFSITNSDPTSSTTYNLSFNGSVSGFDRYCYLVNSTAVGSCSWQSGPLPSSVVVSKINESKTITLFLMDEAGNVSSGLSSTNSVTLATTPVKLATKNISGLPGASLSIVMTGAAPADARLRFRDRGTQQLVHTSTVGTAGQITLPSKAGIYEVELKDLSTGLISYGQATVTGAISSWSFAQKVSPTAYGPYRGVWPSAGRAVGDYNGDGYADYLLAEGFNGSANTFAPGLYLYRYNPGTSQFVFDVRLESTTSFIFGTKLSDIDGDNDLDLVFTRYNPATFTSELCTRANDGTGTFASSVCLSDTIRPDNNNHYRMTDLALRDLDRDGDLDAVLSGYALSAAAVQHARMLVYKNNGAGVFTLDTTLAYVANLQYNNLYVADMNDDGRLDLLGVMPHQQATSTIHLYPQSSSGTFSLATRLTVATSSTIAFLAIGYLNGDAKPDIIASAHGTSGGLYLTSNMSDDTFALVAITSPGEQYACEGMIADLNLDGTPEWYFSPKNRLLYNNKSGIGYRTASTLTSAITLSAANTIAGNETMWNWAEANFDFSDMDNDGKIDLMYFSPYGTMFFEYIRGQ